MTLRDSCDMATKEEIGWDEATARRRGDPRLFDDSPYLELTPDSLEALRRWPDLTYYERAAKIKELKREEGHEDRVR